MPVLNIGIGLAIGIAWLVVCCILIGKIREKERKTPLIAIAVILFILSAIGFIGTQLGAYFGSGALDLGETILNEYLVENHSDYPLVSRGVEPSNVQQAINDLEGIAPRKISEFGLYGAMLQNLYKNSLAKGFEILRARNEMIIKHANEDGRVTSATIIKALVWEINAIIRRIVLISIIVTSAVLTIYIGICAALALKKPRETAATQV
ncbi:MAG: hypothetical protein FWG46_06915 [Treponema sp.]|nr:hypothetical protein [Treponema sp.]